MAPLMLGAQGASRFDVVITEIMADPAPPVGLPNAEYVEIQNVSGAVINMAGWKLVDATGTATINTTILLQPDSILLLCSTGNAPLLAPYGRTAGLTGFPSLDNEGEMLTLKSPGGRVIHAVEYRAGWFRNAVKKEGGWALEMVDPGHPCAGKENWMESSHASGGTPGKKNAVDGQITDNTPPRLLRTYCTDSLTIIALFSEPLDSLSASVPSYYAVENRNIATATPLPPLYNSVQLRLSAPLAKGTVYGLQAHAVTDCSGNVIPSLTPGPGVRIT
jgi:hypothetical protein